MRTQFVTLVALLALAVAAAEPPRQAPPPAGASDLKPVTVSVIDRGSGAAVTVFTYQAWYDAPGRKSPPNGDVWTPVASPTGTFEIQAPPACRLRVMAMAPDYIGGWPMVQEFVVKSSDNPRRVVVRLPRGITVRGTVRDSRTKNPIAGVTVAPLTTFLPGGGPDEDKQVETGADGRYVVRGVDPVMGVSASHPGYIYDSEFPDRKAAGANRDIFLKREEPSAVKVKVVDPDGKPLEGVTVADLNGRLDTSGKDGRLVIQRTSRFLDLAFRKEGFTERRFDFEEIGQELSKPERFVVVMAPTIPLTGRVVAPDGRSVSAFTIAAGLGKLPSNSDSFRREVQDRDGRFRLDLSKEGTTWVGVAAEGCAAWEGWVDVKRGGEPLVIRLSPGVAVSARVVAPEAMRKHVKARLVPRRDKSEIGGLSTTPYAEEFPTRTATLSADGSLRFERVRPDRYRLIIEGRGIAETVLALDVPGGGLDVGIVRIDVPTTMGRVEGRVWYPKSRGGGVWAFADGYVGGFRFKGLGEDDSRSIAFQADENGHFAVDRVPGGMTTVGFPFQFFDVIDSYRWSALVVEGQTTEVGAFDPEGHREFTLAFAIGDGSKAQYQSGTGLGASRKVDNVTVSTDMASLLEKKVAVTPREPMFRVELVPVSKDPLSFAEPDWEDLDAQRKIVLPDVGPGTYRLRVYDWLGVRDLDGGPLFDRDVVVPPGGRGEVRIALGAGCITGKIVPPKANALRFTLDRPVEVTAMAKGSRTPSRRTRCDDDGNFCVRYLSPGTYSLFINDPEWGFCRVDAVEMSAGVVDIGERTLSAGARVSGKIEFPRPSRVPDAVVAVGPSGVSVRRAFAVYSSFDQVELAGLWPGRWTVSARNGDEVLATAALDIEGTGTSHLTLTVGGGQGP